MCNKLHAGYKEIAPGGKAYKLVRQQMVGWGWMALTETIVYDMDTDGWIRWKGYLKDQEPPTTGFCLIPTLKGAIRVRKAWEKATHRSGTKIIEVEYKQGLGRFFEDLFFENQSVDIMLARKFRIIGEVEQR